MPGLSADRMTLSLESLRSAQRPDGGWPYARGADSALEPTALAVAALWAHGLAPDARATGFAFLKHLITADGALRPQASQPDPTALAALAGVVMARCGGDSSVANAIADAMLAWPVRTISGEDVKKIYENDASLRGFPWTPDTFSWVEPTAYGLLLMRALGRGTEPRADEARRLLFDRAIPTGGWNYGNPSVFGTILEPDAMTTALALLALVPDRTHPAFRSGIAYLERAAAAISSRLTLAWVAQALRVARIDVEPILARLGPTSASTASGGGAWHEAVVLLALAEPERNPMMPWRPR